MQLNDTYTYTYTYIYIYTHTTLTLTCGPGLFFPSLLSFPCAWPPPFSLSPSPPRGGFLFPLSSFFPTERTRPLPFLPHLSSASAEDSIITRACSPCPLAAPCHRPRRQSPRPDTRLHPEPRATGSLPKGSSPLRPVLRRLPVFRHRASLPLFGYKRCPPLLSITRAIIPLPSLLPSPIRSYPQIPATTAVNSTSAAISRFLLPAVPPRRRKQPPTDAGAPRSP